jgi:hypothetical protein
MRPDISVNRSGAGPIESSALVERNQVDGQQVTPVSDALVLSIAT